MTAQELRASLLQEAVTGRLVPQRAEEGSAEALYEEIRQEKARLAAEKKIKKEKPLPPVTEEEQPFPIPATWKWVHIGDIFQHNAGKALNNADRKGQYLTYITTSNLYWNSFRLDKLKSMYFSETDIQKCTVQKNDLLVCEGGDFGRAAIWPYDTPTRIQNHIHRLRPFKFLSIKFFYYLFYFYKFSGLINGKGIGIKNLSSNALHNLSAPLPPLTEQKRIVDKLEELLPLVDAYGEAEQRLAAYEARFPDALKRSLLQEAITGRLVPQRAEEGSAESLYEEIRQEKARLIAEKKLKKTKPLPPVTEEEQPFSIPATWKWTRLGECISARAGLAYKKSNLDIQSDEMIRVLRGGNILNMHYALKDDDIRIASTFVSKELLLKRNMIITPAVTSLENLGKAVRIEKDYSDIVVGGFVLTLTPHLNKDIFAKFILYTFCSKYFRDILKQCTNKSGQAFYNISRAKMLLIPVPLPPLEEQKRIVAKLEELLALTERIREARR